MNIVFEVKLLNVLDIIAIIIIVSLATAFQFLYHEIPCPLCLLQRVGLMLISIGFLMNLKFGIRIRHYGLSLIAAIYTAMVSLRQITLHIVPGTGSYGDPVLGLHLYTWVFIISICFIIWIAIMCLIERQFVRGLGTNQFPYKWLLFIVFILIFSISFINVISTFIECGIGDCLEGPIRYKY